MILKRHFYILKLFFTICLITSHANNIYSQLTGGKIYPINGVSNRPKTFANLREAARFVAINGIQGSGQVTFELQKGYNGENDTVTFRNISGLSSSLGITIRPALDFNAVTYVSEKGSSQFVICLSGVSYITLDGRMGGVGDKPGWVISARNSNGRFSVALDNSSGPMTHNTIQYCILEGEQGSVKRTLTEPTKQGHLFSNNRFENNIIKNYDHSLRRYGIGFPDLSHAENAGNIISGNIIYNFVAAGNGLDNGFPGLQISDNRIHDVKTPTSIQDLCVVYNSVCQRTGSTQTISTPFVSLNNDTLQEDFGVEFICLIPQILGFPPPFQAVSRKGIVAPFLSNDSLYLKSAPDAYGTDVIVVTAHHTLYELKDSFGVTITPVNDPPYIAYVPKDTMFPEDFGSLRVLMLSEIFNDVDNPDIHYSFQVLDSGLKAELIHNSLFIESITNFHGIVRLKISACDPQFQISDTLVIQIKPVNDPPFVTNKFTDNIFDEDFTEQFIGSAHTFFADVDNDTLTHRVNILKGFIAVEIRNDSIYVRSIKDFNGEAMFCVTARDKEYGVSDTGRIIINAVNDPPYQLAVIRDTLLDEDFGRKMICDLKKIFADADQDKLTYNIEILGGKLTADIVRDSLYVNSVLNFYGEAGLLITVTDGEYSISQPFEVTIRPVNDAPYIKLKVKDTTFTNYFYQAFLHTMSPLFGDIESDSLMFSANALDSGVSLIISNDSLYLFSAMDFSGDVRLRITARDGLSATSDTFVVSLKGITKREFLLFVSNITGSKSEISSAEIQAVFDQNAEALNACYRKELRRKPDLNGKIRVQIKIDPSGRVAAVSLLSNEVNQEVGLCIQNKIRGWKFPSNNRGLLTVNQSFYFNK